MGWDTQKVRLSLQFHIWHQVRSSGEVQMRYFVYHTIMKIWRGFQLFDQSPIFSANQLSPLKNKPNFHQLVKWDSTKMGIIHQEKLITIGLTVQYIWIEIKLYWNIRKSHDAWVITALQYFGHSGNLYY